MKRFLGTVLILSFFSACTFTGCSEDTTVKETKSVETPGGSTKETTEKTIEKTGDQKEGAAPAPTEPK